MEISTFFKIIISFAGIASTWALFIIKGLREENKRLADKCDKHKTVLHEKTNSFAMEVHKDFVRKDDLRELKQDINDRFDRLEALIKKNT